MEDAIDRAHALLDADRAEEALDALRGETESAEARGLMGVAARSLGRLGESRAHFEAGLALAERERDADRLADLLEDFAELELELHAPSTARALLRRAMSLREPSAETWLALAEAEHRSGDPRAALASLEHATEAADEPQRALVLEMRGDALLELGDESADGAYDSAADVWTRLGDEPAIARCALGRARVAESRGDREAVAAQARAIAALSLSADDRAELDGEIAELLASLE